MNEADLGAGIDPGMAFNPFPYSILDDSNSQPLDRESSSLTTRPDLRPNWKSLCFASNPDPNHFHHTLNLDKTDHSL